MPADQPIHIPKEQLRELAAKHHPPAEWFAAPEKEDLMSPDKPDLDAAIAILKRNAALGNEPAAIRVVLNALTRLRLRDESAVPAPTPEQTAELERMSRVVDAAVADDPLDAMARGLIAARAKATPGEVATDDHSTYVSLMLLDGSRHIGDVRLLESPLRELPDGWPNAEFIAHAFNHAAAVAQGYLDRGAALRAKDERIAALEAEIQKMRDPNWSRDAWIESAKWERLP